MKYTACAAPSKSDAQEEARVGISLCELHGLAEEVLGKRAASLSDVALVLAQRELRDTRDPKMVANTLRTMLRRAERPSETTATSFGVASEIVESALPTCPPAPLPAPPAEPTAPLQPGALPFDPKLAYSKTSRTQARGEYETWKRARLLAAVNESPGGTVHDLAPMARLSEKRAREALEFMRRKGWVISDKKLWDLTKGGGKALQRFRSRLAGTFKCSEKKLAKAGETVSEARLLSLLLEEGASISRALREMGWYPQAIRQLLQVHSVSHIRQMMVQVRNNPIVRNPGAYLYTILMKGPKPPDQERETRLPGLLVRIGELAEDLKKAVQAVAGAWRMTFAQARHLAYAMTRIVRKGQGKPGWRVTVGDVQGVAGWIMKRFWFRK